ncbi:unnamed protein product [Paramecium pentaurelia]|uniref:3-hydroxybutyryl-CoA dehydrogenase n=1 Tax=Paramecium pentaurelia TaxID=43138 RepID=A0A8S1UKM9_9CILI|nr:unnamed protein product [Paramecium pentaurelia]
MKQFFRYRFSTVLGVVGAGQMGTGIAIVGSAVAGLNVRVVDVNEQRLKASHTFISKWCDKEIQKNRMTDQIKTDVLQRFSFHLQISDLSCCDFVVEAAPEKYEMKAEIFKQLVKATKPETILASNTSSISITKLAGITDKPDRIIGMHFMNPVPVMKLIEVIQGLQTSQQTLDKTLELASKMKKEIVIAQDIPGFIANRILMPYINEAIYTLYEGIGTVEGIDKAMKLGTNVPMGPLTLADFIGLDTCLEIMKVLHQDLGDTKYRPCPLLVNYVNAGWLGKKSGRGFYKY